MDTDKEVIYLHLDDIIPNRFQPREVFDERALKELAVSIKEHGVIQPIIVRQIKSNNKYEIIAGERRYKASALAGLTKIPAIIRNLDDKEAAKVALLENLQRKNLNPIEEARTYQKIIELDQMTQEDLAKTMGKSQSAVANKLRLLSLPDEIQKSLLKEEISERHARTLLNLETPEEQKEMLKRVIKEKMTVRKLEEEIKRKNMPEETEKIKDQEDLQSIINPQPVKLQSEKSFLMDPTPIDNSSDKIINYGEINDEEEQDEASSTDELSSSAAEPIDLGKLKSSSVDIADYNSIKQQEDSKADDLDSLLNLKNPDNNQKDNKFFTPAQEALRESENNKENKEDYFSAPDLMSIELPNSSSSAQSGNTFMDKPNIPTNKFDSLIDFANSSPSPTKSNNNLTSLDQTLFQKPIDTKMENNNSKSNKSLGMALMTEAYNSNTKNKEEQYNIQQMVNAIRKTLADLEAHGAKIDTDEMNFENQYQILIKIDKDSNY